MFKIVHLPTGDYVRYGYNKKIIKFDQLVQAQYWLDFRLQWLCTDTYVSLSILQNKLYLFEIIEVDEYV